MLKRFYQKLPDLIKADMNMLPRNLLVEGNPQTGKTKCIEKIY